MESFKQKTDPTNEQGGCVMNKTITVPRVNIPLLRKQRNTLLKVINAYPEGTEEESHLDGLIGFCDHMLDIAEGYAP